MRQLGALDVAPTIADFGERVVRKVIIRLLPLMLLLYLFNQLDRVNIAFGALTMNRDLGFTSEIYGFGAGIFFLGYFLFEIPSNLIMHKVGARRWIARIMFTWGAASVAMAWINSPVNFYIMRFLLGVAEAGFVPGMFLYLSYWVPSKYRGRALAFFILGAPLTSVLAGPLSTTLLEMNGALGMAGWQWLYIVQGLPPILLAFVTWSYLTDNPSQAAWLTEAERRWLDQTLEAEQEVARRSGSSHSLLDGFRSPKVILLSSIYLSTVIGLYGMAFWLPQIVHGFGLSNLQVGFVVSIPYLLACIGCYFWARYSDRTGERRWHFALSCFVSAVGFMFSAVLGAQWLALIPISFAVIGIYAGLPIFWTLPNQYLTGLGAVGGIALINSIGNLGGFIGPYLVGWLKQSTGSFVVALVCLSMSPVLAGVLTLLLPRKVLQVRSEKEGV